VPPAVPHRRDLRLDLFRGIALWLIFLDHMPSNVVSWITIRNYGFSDATEIFVFISGYTVALVYGRVMRDEGFLVGSARILRRAWQIYVAHIFLFIVYLAEIAYVAKNFGNPLYTEEMGIFEVLKQPDVMFIQALLLKFKPVNMDVLPLYIALMLCFPPILWLLLRRPALALGLSGLLYALTWLFDWNLPSYPSGEWYFNPLAWQLLFVFGGWCALGGTDRVADVVRSPFTLAAAIAFLLASAAIVLTWYFPHLAWPGSRWASDFFHPAFDKTYLGVFRFLHFVALAVITVRFVAPDWQGLSSWVFRPAIICGQHSLEIFCLGVFLAFAGHFIFDVVSNRVAVQFIVSAAGIALMVATAALIGWYNRMERRSAGGRSGPANADIAGGEV
jgi:hypothetical protein